jgi:hypothetical protein
MTPFIDGNGFAWLRNVFGAAPAQAQRILILREVGRYAVDLSVHHTEWLRALNVSVRDYYVPHTAENTTSRGTATRATADPAAAGTTRAADPAPADRAGATEVDPSLSLA